MVRKELKQFLNQIIKKEESKKNNEERKVNETDYYTQIHTHKN